MLMTMDTVLVELQNAVPEFHATPEWLSEALTYLVFGDFARFICSEAEVLQYVDSEAEALQLSQVQVSVAFLERALREGDQDVRDLIFDCIESVASCEWIDPIKKYFGPEINALWAKCLSDRDNRPG
jgi:hypothetical protein